MRLFYLFLFCCLPALTGFGQTAPQRVISSGGGAANAAGYRYHYTIGEPVIGTFQGGALGLTKGFHQPLMQIALPVEWLNFSAIRAGDDALLRWSVESDLAGEWYAIERSVDGIVFENAGQLQAEGRSTPHYSYVDAKIQRYVSGRVYYRLRHWDTNGESQLSRTVALNLMEDGGKMFSLYPNPAHEQAWLSYALNASAEGVQVLLSNATGQIVWSAPLREQHGLLEIPTAHLSAGLYTLSLTGIEQARQFKLRVLH